MATYLGKIAPPPPITQTLDTRQWRDWFYSLFNAVNNSNVNSSEYQTATANQTVFTINTFSYTVGNNTLYVYVNGSKQINTLNYTETTPTIVTFTSGLNVGDIVEFTNI